MIITLPIDLSLTIDNRNKFIIFSSKGIHCLASHFGNIFGETHSLVSPSSATMLEKSFSSAHTATSDCMERIQLNAKKNHKNLNLKFFFTLFANQHHFFDFFDFLRGWSKRRKIFFKVTRKKIIKWKKSWQADSPKKSVSQTPSLLTAWVILTFKVSQNARRRDWKSSVNVQPQKQ